MTGMKHDFLREHPDYVRSLLEQHGYGSRSFHRQFPRGQETPEMIDLAGMSFQSTFDDRHSALPQKPKAVSVMCSRINGAKIFELSPGEIFFVTGRAGQVGSSGLASLNYGLGLGTPLLVITVHSCTADGVCRTERFAKHDNAWGTKVSLTQLEATPTFPGIEVQNFTFPRGQVPQADQLHCRRRALKILQNSEDVRQKVAEGKLLVVESYYDEKSGRVHWLSCWRASALAQQIEKMGNLQRIIDAPSLDPNHLAELHPAVAALVSLVAANKHYADGFCQPRAPEHVGLRCSDSRMAEKDHFPPNIVEWLSTAGNTPEEEMLPGLIDTLQRIDRDLSRRTEQPRRYPEGHKQRATFFVMAHTECGAVKAADAARSNGVTDHGSLGDLIVPVGQRLQTYFEDRTAGKFEDPHLVHAAQANAISAIIQILTSPNPDAREAQRMVEDGRALFVPATHSLKTGISNWFPPFGADAIGQLKRDFPAWY